MWPVIKGFLVFLAIGLVVLTMLVFATDPLPWLTIIEGVALAVMSVALVVALVLPGHRLSPPPPRANSITAVIAVLGMAVATTGLVTERPLAAAAGFLIASSILTLRWRSRTV